MGLLIISMLLIIIIVVFLYYIYIVNASIDKLIKNLNFVIDGNYNVRFFTLPFTQKKIVELAIKLNQSMQEIQKISERRSYLESTRKQMIANMSHDLRTPLTSILGYLEVVKNDSTLKDNEKEKYIDIISIKALKLHQLIHDFFELSRIDSNDLSFNMEKINLKEKVEESLIVFYQEFMDEGIEVKVDIPSKPVYIKGDSVSIDRILYNLISNAIKYGKDGKLVGVCLTEKKQQVILQIWDSGQGIMPNDIPKLFERLYTSEISRNSKQFKGSGLGLTITKKLVQKHGGTIKVSSIPRRKTTFSVCFPNWNIYK